MQDYRQLSLLPIFRVGRWWLIVTWYTEILKSHQLRSKEIVSRNSSIKWVRFQITYVYTGNSALQSSEPVTSSVWSRGSFDASFPYAYSQRRAHVEKAFWAMENQYQRLCPVGARGNIRTCKTFINFATQNCYIHCYVQWEMCFDFFITLVQLTSKNTSCKFT